MTREGIIVKENEPTDWYIPGKHLVLADMLSRSTADNQDEAGATTDVEVHAIQLLGYRVTEATQKELQAATARDRYLQSVIASLSVGLPVQDSGDDFWLGLLAYRSTPLEDGRSPGELARKAPSRQPPGLQRGDRNRRQEAQPGPRGKTFASSAEGCRREAQRRCMVPKSSSGGFAISKVLPCQNGGPEAVKAQPSSPTSKWRTVHRGKRRRH
ncbi:uncharacterized protein LOC125758688 isoform X2 [Rhipicephalus sanguineus]|uniref:uncharacterized protein LOC125758688 isoform X2 n=1 Tax=Rhipicephalus sanguineus TaxID=34632 RepID=UPI0020C56C67|nr:uncharacterized protein LOC125758688 isoform X2 [Rhipicephalus sanguineus]